MSDRLLRTLAVIALTAVLLTASGCALARASAIANLRVMPEGWGDEVDSQDREGWACVAWATTGQCQIWVAPPETEEGVEGEE